MALDDEAMATVLRYAIEIVRAEPPHEFEIKTREDGLSDRPMENGFIESLNGKFRDDCLNENLIPRSGRRAGEDRDLAV